MRHKFTPKSSLERINLILDKNIIKKIDEFINDPGLKKGKVNRSVFVRDVMDYIFIDFEKKGKKSILERLFPEE